MRGSETSRDHSKPKNPSRRFETFRDDLRRSNRLKSSRNVSNRLGGFFGFEWSRLVSDPLNSYRYVSLEIQSLKNQSYGLWKTPVSDSKTAVTDSTRPFRSSKRVFFEFEMTVSESQTMVSDSETADHNSCLRFLFHTFVPV